MALREQPLQIGEFDTLRGLSKIRFPSTFIPRAGGNPRHSGADAAKADQPKVLPVNCMPSSRSQLPARISRSIRAMPRAAAHISAIVDSATAVSP